MVSLGQGLSFMQQFDVSCFCFAETNLNWHRPHVQMNFLTQQRTIWKGLGGAKSALSSIDLDSASDFQTGGTATSAVGAWCTRVLATETDPLGMGRWSCLTFIGHQNRRISVVTGYRCVRSLGDNSVWTQEKFFLRAKLNKANPHPGRQFIEDLTHFLKLKRTQGHDLIVSLDTNESFGTESTGISKLIHDCGLYDLLDIPNADASTQLVQDTYRHGTNWRIDFILGMEHSLHIVCRGGTLAYNNGIVSDHGVFLLILTLPFFLMDLLRTLSPCPPMVSPPKMPRRLKNIWMLWKRTGLITGLPTALLDSPMMLHPSHALFYNDVMMPLVATLPGGC
jgi:hypothetical protein